MRLTLWKDATKFCAYTSTLGVLSGAVRNFYFEHKLCSVGHIEDVCWAQRGGITRSQVSRRRRRVRRRCAETTHAQHREVDLWRVRFELPRRVAGARRRSVQETE